MNEMCKEKRKFFVDRVVKKRRRVPIIFGIILGLFLWIGGTRLYAEPVFVEDVGYYVNIPEGWEPLDASEDEKGVKQFSFTDPNRVMVFQITTFPGDRFDSSEKMSTHFKEKYHASGDHVGFTFNGRKSRFSDYSFKAGKIPVRGYFVFINGWNHDFAVGAFCAEKMYQRYHDFLLSCVDSFAIGEESLTYPGPVSQFYYAFPPPQKKRFEVPFHDSSLQFQVDTSEVEATQVVIEREARVLSGYQSKGRLNEMQKAAWQRYYRMIFRDNYLRFNSLAESLYDKVKENSSDRETAEQVLSWLQGFEYHRTGTVSDLLSPVASVLHQKGDCDALGLIFCILMKQFGIESILTVSAQYAHSIAGVNVEGDGARYPYDGKQYVVAEFTSDVALGLIDRSIADPRGWVPIDFE